VANHPRPFRMDLQFPATSRYVAGRAGPDHFQPFACEGATARAALNQPTTLAAPIN
jgi:hypothetical protein